MSDNAKEHRNKKTNIQLPLNNSGAKMSSLRHQVLNSENFEELKYNRVLAVQCESLLQAGRLAWFEEFTWLEYRIPLDVLYCKYCAQTTSSGSLAVGRKPDKTRRIDLIVHAQTDMHINITHHFQEGKDAQSNVIYISSNSKFCNQKKVHIKAVSIADSNRKINSSSNGRAKSQCDQITGSVKLEQGLNGTDSFNTNTGNSSTNSAVSSSTNAIDPTSNSTPPVALGVVIPQNLHSPYNLPGMNHQVGADHSIMGNPTPSHIPSPLNYSLKSIKENPLILTWSSLAEISKNEVQRKKIHSILLRHKIKQDWFNEFEWLQMNIAQLKFYCTYCRLRGTNSTLARGKSVTISKSKRNDFIIHAETDSHRNVMQSLKDGSWRPLGLGIEHEPTVAELLHDRRVSAELNRSSVESHTSTPNSLNAQGGAASVERSMSLSPQIASVHTGSQVIVIEPSLKENLESFTEKTTDNNSALNLTQHHSDKPQICEMFGKSDSLTRASDFNELAVDETISPSLVEIAKVINSSFKSNWMKNSSENTTSHESEQNEESLLQSSTTSSSDGRQKLKPKQEFIDLCDSPEAFDRAENSLKLQEPLSLVVDSSDNQNVRAISSPKECFDILSADTSKLHRTCSSSNLSELCNEMLSDGSTDDLNKPIVAEVSQMSAKANNVTTSEKGKEDANTVTVPNKDINAEVSDCENFDAISMSPGLSSVEDVPCSKSFSEDKISLRSENKMLNMSSVLTTDKESQPQQDNPFLPFHDTFWRELNHLRQNGTMCDVTLAAISRDSGDMVKFHAHKLILTTASNYFKQLFTSNGNTSALLFPNITPEGLKGVLDYIYGEPVTGSAEYYKACYRAANVLGVHSAKMVFRNLMSEVCSKGEIFIVTMGLPHQSLNGKNDSCKQSITGTNKCAASTQSTVHSDSESYNRHSIDPQNNAEKGGSSNSNKQHTMTIQRKSERQRMVRNPEGTGDANSDKLQNTKKAKLQVRDMQGVGVEPKYRHDSSKTGVRLKRKRSWSSVSEDDHAEVGVSTEVIEMVKSGENIKTNSSDTVSAYTFTRITPVEAERKADKLGQTTGLDELVEIANGREESFKTAVLRCYMCRSFVPIPLKCSTETSHKQKLLKYRGENKESFVQRNRRLTSVRNGNKGTCYVRCRLCTGKLIHGFVKTSLGNRVFDRVKDTNV